MELLFDRLAVKVETQEKKGNIYLPEVSQDEERPRGVVLHVGPGKINDEGKLTEMAVKVGDRVIIQRYGAQPIEVDGQKLLVTEQKQVIAILERA